MKKAEGTKENGGGSFRGPCSRILAQLIWGQFVARFGANLLQDLAFHALGLSFSHRTFFSLRFAFHDSTHHISSNRFMCLLLIYIYVCVSVDSSTHTHILHHHSSESEAPASDAKPKHTHLLQPFFLYSPNSSLQLCCCLVSIGHGGGGHRDSVPCPGGGRQPPGQEAHREAPQDLFLPRQTQPPDDYSRLLCLCSESHERWPAPLAFVSECMQ